MRRAPRGRRASFRLISGGQTGVDRGALDAALELGLDCGGTAPKGRLAEDGRVPARYPLRECDFAEYAVRTEINVRDADATLILCRGPLTGGTRLTWELALRHKKPVAVVDVSGADPETEALDFLRKTRPGTLNVAGPRESSSPGIGDKARFLMVQVLRRWLEG